HAPADGPVTGHDEQRSGPRPDQSAQAGQYDPPPPAAAHHHDDRDRNARPRQHRWPRPEGGSPQQARAASPHPGWHPYWRSRRSSSPPAPPRPTRPSPTQRPAPATRSTSPSALLGASDETGPGPCDQAHPERRSPGKPHRYDTTARSAAKRTRPEPSHK